MAKTLVPIQISPGFSDGTDYEVGAQWIRGNLIRWHESRLKPWKPWRKMFSTPIAGAALGMHFWTASNGLRYLCIATATNVYLIDIVKNTLYDITPVGMNTAATYNIGPGYSGDVYSGSYDYNASAGLGGLTFIFTDYARYAIDNWGDSLLAMKEGDGKVYKLDPTLLYDTQNNQTDTTADITDGSTTLFTDDHTKYTVAAEVTGTGIDPYTTVVSIDTNLTASGYEITLNQPATQTLTNNTVTINPQKVLEIITTDSDPLRARGLIVTAERYLLLYGEGGITRKLRWSASEDYTTFSSTTQNPTEAGDLEVSTKGFLMACKKVRAGILVFSSVDVHLLSYLGPPFIYGLESLAEACGPVSSACIQQIAERTVWLATDGFWVFDGNVTPLPCPILESFLADINMQKGTLVAAGSIREYGEVIWFYCSQGNADTRPDKYILWGTRNNTWSMGVLSRDAFLEEEAYVFPIAVGPDSNNNTYIWAHEVDRTLADDGTIETYAETGAYEIEVGQRLARVSRIWHDLEKQGAAGSYPEFTFFTSSSADGTENTRGPYTPQADGNIDLRWQGRQLRMKVAAPISEEWTLGKQRLEVQPGGTR